MGYYKGGLGIRRSFAVHPIPDPDVVRQAHMGEIGTFLTNGSAVQYNAVKLKVL